MKMFSSGVLWNLSNAKYSHIESNLDPVNKLDSFNAQKKSVLQSPVVLKIVIFKIVFNETS